MALTISRAALVAALGSSSATTSSYLDIQNGEIVHVDDTASDAPSETLRAEIMESYGDRFRYIPGKSPDTTPETWLANEGLQAELI